MTVVRPQLQFGVAELDGDGELVLGFREKPRSRALDQWRVLLPARPGALEYLGADSVLEREPLQRLAGAGRAARLPPRGLLGVHGHLQGRDRAQRPVGRRARPRGAARGTGAVLHQGPHERLFRAGVRGAAQNPFAMIVLGIDPGLANTGYGVVARRGGGLAALDGGVIETPAGLPIERRLATIHGARAGAAGRARPDAVALEELYFGQNVRTAFAVGHARGVAMLAAGRTGVPCACYTPQQVKAAVCGNGRAAKDQVARMVQTLLGLPELPRPDHASDALAVAICHANCAPLARRSRLRPHERVGRTALATPRAPSPRGWPHDRPAARRGRRAPRRPRRDPLRRRRLPRRRLRGDAAPRPRGGRGDRRCTPT